VIQDAFAMGPATGGAGAEGPGFLISMAPFILMFLIMYLLLIRPQQKRQKDQQKMLDELQNGDKVVTGGGIIGTVSGLKADVVTVRVADNVKLEVQRSSISRVVNSKKTDKEVKE
jgi:preprotein translocase subunit YajC